MDHEETIHFFRDDHQKLKDVLSKLTEFQMNTDKVQGSWTVKDIIAHISAWNWEIITQAERVLSGIKPWYTDKTEAEFNKEAVKTRESWSVEKIISEWYESFTNLISKLERFSEEEWNFELDEEWPEGGKVSVSSIFGYRYHGEGHEGGHATIIRNYFEL
ncbi:MAG: DinB family protein [Candidatus Thorarchaeota archaeon]